MNLLLYVRVGICVSVVAPLRDLCLKVAGPCDDLQGLYMPLLMFIVCAHECVFDITPQIAEQWKD